MTKIGIKLYQAMFDSNQPIRFWVPHFFVVVTFQGTPIILIGQVKWKSSQSCFSGYSGQAQAHSIDVVDKPEFI